MSHLWTPAEDALLLRMRDVEHLPFQEIIRHLNRTRDACKARYTHLNRTRDACKARYTLLKKEPEFVRAPIDTIADRDERYQLWLRQPAAAALLGDPLPGRSALDMRGKQG